ncbi:MAG TPA: HEAT repeat domain-containing protein [Polyangiaceae bacterium]|nr:HEAT repeat domain-containing protein [Polyangiaceae bacterium]
MLEVALELDGETPTLPLMLSCRTMLPSRVMRALSFIVLLGSLLWSAPAAAQASDVDRLIYNLANSEDFRVRTQAALALGASKSERATAPLCAALGDSNTTVRAASAAALGRLASGGALECLERRLGSETSDVVKATIQKALDIIRSGGGAEPVFAGDTRFYVAIGKTTDKTGRGTAEVDGIVRSAMTSKVGQTAGLLVAPQNETPADAKRRLAAHAGVKGFFLSPGVAPPDYAGGNLKVKIEVAMLSYPEKNLIGSYSVNLTEPGVSPGSNENENELLRMAAERAIDKFAGIAANQ